MSDDIGDSYPYLEMGEILGELKIRVCSHLETYEMSDLIQSSEAAIAMPAA